MSPNAGGSSNDDLDELHLGVDWEKEFDGQEFSIE